MVLKYDYRVLESARRVELEEFVIHKLHDGWTLVGGVTFDPYSRAYLQAVTKNYAAPSDSVEEGKL